MLKFLFLFLTIPYVVLGQLKGKVISIADGDTFTLLTEDNNQIKVRLHGVDCPEKAQDFGMVAKKFLSDLIYQKEVNVKEMDVDRYGRTIGMVTVKDVNINEALLKAGLAWHYKRYDKNSIWAGLESKAKKEKVGLWALQNALAPWEFRKSKSL